MVEWMLSNIICHEFENRVGKGCYETKRAMHVGFGLSCGKTSDQYRVAHMYIYGPANYVYVAVQTERIDKNGKRHVEPMKLLSYHDSCWRDAIQSWIFDQRAELNVFRSFDHLFDWYDILTLTEAETNYLHQMDEYRTASHYDGARKKAIEEKMKVNPFDERSLWGKRKAKSETEAMGLPPRKTQVNELQLAGFSEEAANHVVEGRKSRARGMKHGTQV